MDFQLRHVFPILFFGGPLVFGVVYYVQDIDIFVKYFSFGGQSVVNATNYPLPISFEIHRMSHVTENTLVFVNKYMIALCLIMVFLQLILVLTYLHFFEGIENQLIFYHPVYGWGTYDDFVDEAWPNRMDPNGSQNNIVDEDFEAFIDNIENIINRGYGIY